MNSIDWFYLLDFEQKAYPYKLLNFPAFHLGHHWQTPVSEADIFKGCRAYLHSVIKARAYFYTY